jgi:aryl-alcohol dehydrogenase-like predicted oxidoreductase
MAPPAELPTRKLGRDGPVVSAMGFGLMGLSGTYGETPPDEERLALLDRAWELGYTNWDTADLYGDNEDLLGRWFRLHPERRADIFLASKFAFRPVQENGGYTLKCDSSPKNARRCCEKSLARLGVDCIDLYYVHRTDTVTPIEKTMEELVRLKRWAALPQQS